VERHATALARHREVERIQVGLQQLNGRERQVLEYVIGGWLNKTDRRGAADCRADGEDFPRNLIEENGRSNSVAELVRQCENRWRQPTPATLRLEPL